MPAQIMVRNSRQYGMNSYYSTVHEEVLHTADQQQQVEEQTADNEANNVGNRNDNPTLQQQATNNDWSGDENKGSDDEMQKLRRPSFVFTIETTNHTTSRQQQPEKHVANKKELNNLWNRTNTPVKQKAKNNNKCSDECKGSDDKVSNHQQVGETQPQWDVEQYHCHAIALLLLLIHLLHWCLWWHEP